MIYVAHAHGQFKIGTSIVPEKRIKVQRGAHTGLRHVATIAGDRTTEQELHYVLHGDRVRPDWFRRHGRRVEREWFWPTPRVLAFVARAEAGLPAEDTIRLHRARRPNGRLAVDPDMDF